MFKVIQCTVGSPHPSFAGISTSLNIVSMNQEIGPSLNTHLTLFVNYVVKIEKYTIITLSDDLGVLTSFVFCETFIGTQCPFVSVFPLRTRSENDNFVTLLKPHSNDE